MNSREYEELSQSEIMALDDNIPSYGLFDYQWITLKFTWIDNISDAEKEKILDIIDHEKLDEFNSILNKLLPNSDLGYDDTTDNFEMIFIVRIEAEPSKGKYDDYLVYEDFNEVDDNLIKEVKLELLNLLKKYNITEIIDINFSATELTDNGFECQEI